jgi:hypothetical protein
MENEWIRWLMSARLSYAASRAIALNVREALGSELFDCGVQGVHLRAGMSYPRFTIKKLGARQSVIEQC